MTGSESEQVWNRHTLQTPTPCRPAKKLYPLYGYDYWYYTEQDAFSHHLFTVNGRVLYRGRGPPPPARVLPVVLFHAQDVITALVGLHTSITLNTITVTSSLCPCLQLTYRLVPLVPFGSWPFGPGLWIALMRKVPFDIRNPTAHRDPAHSDHQPHPQHS